MGILQNDINKGYIPFNGDYHPVSIYEGEHVIFEPKKSEVEVADSNNLTVENTYNDKIDELIVYGNTHQEQHALRDNVANVVALRDIADKTYEMYCQENLMTNAVFDWEMEEIGDETKGSFDMHHGNSVDPVSPSGYAKKWRVTKTENAIDEAYPELTYQGEPGVHIYSATIKGSGTVEICSKRVVLSTNYMPMTFLTEEDGIIRIKGVGYHNNQNYIEFVHCLDKLEKGTTTPWVLCEDDDESNPPDNDKVFAHVSIPANENLLITNTVLTSTKSCEISSWGGSILDATEILEPNTTYTFYSELEIVEKATNETVFQKSVRVFLYCGKIAGHDRMLFNDTDYTVLGDKRVINCTFTTGDTIPDGYSMLVYTNRYLDEGEEVADFDTVKFTNTKLEKGSIVTAWIPSAVEQENGEKLPYVEVTRKNGNILDVEELQGTKFVNGSHMFDYVPNVKIPLVQGEQYFCKAYIKTGGEKAGFAFYYSDGTYDVIGADVTNAPVFVEGLSQGVRTVTHFGVRPDCDEPFGVQINVCWCQINGTLNGNGEAKSQHYLCQVGNSLQIPVYDNTSTTTIQSDVPLEVNYLKPMDTKTDEDGLAPTPNFPEEIESVGGEVVVSGKNLFNGGILLVNDNTYFVTPSYSSAPCTTIKPNTDYTLSINVPCGIANDSSVYLWKDGNNIDITNIDNQNVYIFNSGDADGISFYAQFTEEITDESSIKIQLEYGTEATPYEPYAGEPQTITIPTLNKIGDVQDILHVDRASQRMWVERKCKEIGVEEFTESNKLSGTRGCRFKYINSNIKNKCFVWCNRLLNDILKGSYSSEGNYIVCDEKGLMNIRLLEVIGLEDFKEKFNDLKVIYQLAEPEIEEVEYNEDIPTYYPTTVINTGTLPTTVKATMKQFK